MLASLIASFAGLLFGFGLAISMMINPAKVLGFLDIGGAWDPSLILVLVGAIGTTAIGFTLARRLDRPLAAQIFHGSPKHSVDLPLVVGSLIFGVGWGLVGYCPGPALAAFALGNSSAIQVVMAMIGGIAVFEVWQWVSRRIKGVS
jgi:uncharacterized membrane protein YedE/YeeE